MEREHTSVMQNCFQERLGLFLEIFRLDSETNSVFLVKAHKDRDGFSRGVEEKSVGLKYCGGWKVCRAVD